MSALALGASALRRVGAARLGRWPAAATTWPASVAARCGASGVVRGPAQRTLTVRLMSSGLGASAEEKQLRFLVIDGYTSAGREELEAGGASTAGVLYRSMLDRAARHVGWNAGAHSDIVYPADEGFAEPSAEQLRAYDGVAWTGCSLTIHSGEPVVEAQIDFQRRIYAAGVPAFGSCWAAQVAVVAAGGKCGANPKGREMGLARKIALTDAGRGHPMFRGKPHVFDAYTSHSDEVTHLPDTAVVLAGNAYTRVQAVAVTHLGTQFWAVQTHPEYDLWEMAMLINCRKAKLTGMGFFASVEEAEAYVADLVALHKAGPVARKDLAWRLGYDNDVLGEDMRCLEVRNWVEAIAVPRALTRLALA